MYGTDVQNHAVSGWLCTSTSTVVRIVATLFQTCHGRYRQDSGPHIILTENILYMNKHTRVGTVQYCTLERCETFNLLIPGSARLSVMTNSTSDISTSSRHLDIRTSISFVSRSNHRTITADHVYVGEKIGPPVVGHEAQHEYYRIVEASSAMHGMIGIMHDRNDWQQRLSASLHIKLSTLLLRRTKSDGVSWLGALDAAYLQFLRLLLACFVLIFHRDGCNLKLLME